MAKQIIFTGGRDFDNPELVRAHLGTISPRAILIHGACNLADALSGREPRGLDAWLHVIATDMGFSIITCWANWKRDGLSAGPIRNSLMLSIGAVDELHAFPGGRGTHDMMRQARATGVPVHKVGW